MPLCMLYEAGTATSLEDRPAVNFTNANTPTAPKGMTSSANNPHHAPLESSLVLLWVYKMTHCELLVLSCPAERVQEAPEGQPSMLELLKDVTHELATYSARVTVSGVVVSVLMTSTRRSEGAEKPAMYRGRAEAVTPSKIR